MLSRVVSSTIHPLLLFAFLSCICEASLLDDFPTVGNPNIYDQVEVVNKNNNNNANPNPAEYSIAVLGIVKHFDQVRPSSLESFESWCSNFKNADIYILTSDPLEYVLSPRLRLPCNATLVQDNAKYDNKDNNKTNVREKEKGLRDSSSQKSVTTRGARVRRIAIIRDQLRSVVRSEYLKNKAKNKTLDAILVIDLDLLRMPSLSSLGDGVSRVANKEADVVCANGGEKFMGLVNIAYDLFAMELFPWPWQQRRLFTEAIAIAPKLHHPADFCFGGMAIYNPEEYLDEQCNYSEGTGEECEHVTLHKCMKSKRPEFEIGVLGTMQTRREFDTTVCFMILALFLLTYPVIVVRVCHALKRARERKRREE